jgi:hypothetical protein
MFSEKAHKINELPDRVSHIIRSLFIISLILLSVNIRAQDTTTCAEKLRDANLLFDQGNIQQIPGLLEKCLRSGFNKEEELAAYKLLILSLLLDNKTEEADAAMIEFLKRNPEYKLSPTDHSSFKFLFNSFEINPTLQVSIHAGTSIPFLMSVNDNLTAGLPGKSFYGSNAANMMLSAEAQFRLNDRMDLCFEAGYSRLKFTNEVDFLNFGVINYAEIQNRLEIPVTITYNLKSSGRFTPYVRGGAGFAINFRTLADVSLIMTDRNNPGDRTGETLVRTDSRTPVDIFIQLGGGIKYKIPRGYFFAELRSDLGIIQQNISGGKTVNLLEYYYLWSDPGFRINSLGFNIGYTHIFYKPSKRTE